MLAYFRSINITAIKKNIYIFLFVCLILASPTKSSANHIAGGEITYRPTSTSGVWQITLTIYRDCSGISFGSCIGSCSSCSSEYITVTDSSSHTIYYNLSYVSVTDVDINSLCLGSKSICTNNGCRIAGWITPGIEKYIYQGNINLDSFTGCNVIIAYAGSARVLATTLAVLGETFYIEASFNKCYLNSSPVPTNDPIVAICSGQAFQYNMGAIDPEHDSISYSFTPALIGHNTSVSYVSPYSAIHPFPFYAPATAPFPLGISCNPTNGDIMFTPSYGSGGGFIGVMAVQIKQWKKIAGVYTLIGTTMRDNLMYILTCPPNHPPTIMTNPSNGTLPKLAWKVVFGNSICFNVIGKDTDFMPYNIPVISDTSYLSWNSALATKGATFIPAYNNATRKINGPREDNYQFCWTPDSSAISAIPWCFTVKAIDYHCPQSGRTTLSVSIKVVETPSAIIQKNISTCYKWNLNYTSPHPEYIDAIKWQISNTTGIFNDTSYSSFNTSTVNNFLFVDTGKYVVKLILYIDYTLGTHVTIYDTIYNQTIFKLNSLTDTTACAGTTIKLKAKYSGGKKPFTFRWYDNAQSGTTLSLNDSLIASPASTKNYTLQLTDSSGCTLTDISTINIHPLPVGSPSVVSTVCEGANTIFDAGNNNGNVKSYLWSTGDTTRTITQKINTFCWVKINDTLGCSNQDSFYFFVNPYPKPTVGYTQNNFNECLSGNIFVLNDTSSISSGTISRTWNFGDGTNSVNDNLNKNFANAGTYSIKLFETSDHNCIDSAIKIFTVYPQPNAGFTQNNFAQCINGNNFMLNDTSIILSGAMTRLWDFGDTTTSTNSFINKKYLQSGNFNVKLLLISNNNCSDSLTKTFTVYPQTNIGFIVNNLNQCLSGNNFLFTDTSTISSGTFLRNWNFGDGNISTLSAVNKSYLSNGIYQVKLNTTTNFGCVDSIQKTILVYPKPKAGFIVEDSVQCLIGNNFLFTDNSNVTNGTYNRYWNLGDATTNTSSSFNKIYSASGKYQVQLKIVDSKNCSDSTTHSIIIKQNPVKPQILSLTNTQIQSTFSANTYQWFLNNNLIANSNSQAIYIHQNGKYFVKVDSTNGCSNSSNPLNVTVFYNDHILIYPNPNNGNFTIYFIELTGTKNIDIYDMEGKFLKQFSTSEELIHINFEQLFSSGMYMLKIQTDQGMFNEKVVVE